MNKLGEIRKNKGIKINDLCLLLNLSRQSIYNLEKGLTKLNEDQITLICKKYNVSSKELLGI